jgi:hypothetical protein
VPFTSSTFNNFQQLATKFPLCFKESLAINMKSQTLLMALAAAPAALAHTAFTNFYVDGVSQGDGVAMRMRMDPKVATFPLEDLSSKNMACSTSI